MMGVESEHDAALIRAAQSDPTAFGALFDRHFRSVYRFCGRRVGRDLAEDLAGETFRRAFEARHSYNLNESNALPWLFRIARNLVRDAIRSRAAEDRAYARLQVLAGMEPLREGDQAPGRAEARADLARLARLLVTEPEESVDALFLHVWDGLSYLEIATALRVPVGTVRSRLSRLRDRLETSMSDGAPDRQETHLKARNRYGSNR
jgi:RNA polymerase sigma factor (sigma-70 family)